MAGPLKILMLEDNPNDTEIIQRAVKKEMPNCVFTVTMTKQGYLDALNNFHPDLILSDNTMPQFNASEALDIMLQKALAIPFILVTGTVSEEFAAGIIKAGADDYILKDRLTRLPSAIDAALQKKKAEAIARNSEDVRKLIMKSALDAIICIDTDGKIIVWNTQAEVLFGWKEEIILGKQLVDTIIPERYREKHSLGFDHFLKTGEGSILNKLIELTALNIGGKEFPVEIFIVPVEQNETRFFCAFIRDITDRKKASEQLQQSYEEIRRLASHLENIREEERINISREIHDQLGQQMTVMKMDVSWLNKKLQATDEVTREKLSSLAGELDNTIKMVRKISAQLRPTLLDDMGLMAAIEWHLREFQSRSGIQTHMAGSKDEPVLPASTKTGLFRIVQESLTNVIRHANAKNVVVSVALKKTSFELTIQDDGAGFEVEKATAKKTFGLLGMKERAAMMEGTYSITSSPGMGTTVVVSVPL